MRTVRRISLVLPLVVALGGLPVAQFKPKPHAIFHALATRTQGMVKAPDPFRMVGVSWSATDPAPRAVSVRTSMNGHHWTKWTDLEVASDEAPDPGADEAAPHSTSPLWVGHARFADVRWTGALTRGVKINVIDPGPDPSTPPATASATPAKPGIISRAGWGADESIRHGPVEYADSLQMIFIHHTATSNSYAPSDSAAIVRSIYVYHVKTNGWDDIGYNILVDRYGQIFEGRYGGLDRPRIGAHTLGFNTHSAGISVIGTFGGSPPPSAAIAALQKVTAWRMDVAHIDPSGTTVMTSGGNPRYAAGTKVKLKTISGHRDVYDTDCPGLAFYRQLPSLRTAVAGIGDPKVYYPQASSPIITPNGDGINDTTILSARFSSNVSWTSSITGSGKTWRSASGTGMSFSYPWNAKGTSGNLAPGGMYTFAIDAHNAHGSVHVETPVIVSRFPSMKQTLLERAPKQATRWRWFLRNANTAGASNAPFDYGNPRMGDYPVVGDWNGNGSTSIGIVRPDNTGHLVWYLRNANSPGKPSITPFAYGSVASDDFPVVGDWNGDGTATIGVARPVNGEIEWFLRNSNTAGSPDVAAFKYGTTAEGFPIQGDWDGVSGTSAGFASIDLTSGHWMWNLRDTNAGTVVPFSYGNVTLGDHPISGDWDGDGKTYVGVSRPDSSKHLTWLLRNTNLVGTTDVPPFSYGSATTDLPVTGDWDNDPSHTATIGVVRAVS